MRERLDVPVLALDAAEHGSVRFGGRIAAFLETLQ
jgi:hypothetical protein